MANKLTSLEVDNVTRTVISVDDIYPVGSIYMSTNSVSPAVLFGGTWVQLQDTFLLSSGTTYTSGATGGNDTHTHTTAGHTLTASESGVPAHAHAHDHTHWATGNDNTNYMFTSTSTIARRTVSSGSGATNHYYGSGALTSHGSTGNPNNVNTSNNTAQGATDAHSHGDTGSSSNMPPYLVVNMWERTA